MTKERLKWIDVIKAICMITIVIGHMSFPFRNNSIFNYIESFVSFYKVSLYFVIAGFLIKDERLFNTITFLKSKFKSIYLKTIIIGILAVLLHNFFINIGFYQENVIYGGKTMHLYNTIDIFKNLILTMFLANREVILGPLWFACCLFFAFLIYAFTAKVVNMLFNGRKCEKVVRISILFLMMSVSYGLNYFFHINIPRISNAFTAAYLIDFGKLIFKYLKFDNVYIFLICFIIYSFLPFFGRFSFNINMIVNPIFLAFTAFVETYFVSFLAKKIQNINFLSYIGKNSFYIMAFQFLGFKIGALILSIFISDYNVGFYLPEINSIWFFIFYLIFGICIPLLIGKIFSFLKRGAKYVKIKKYSNS